MDVSRSDSPWHVLKDQGSTVGRQLRAGRRPGRRIRVRIATRSPWKKHYAQSAAGAGLRSGREERGTSRFPGDAPPGRPRLSDEVTVRTMPESSAQRAGISGRLHGLSGESEASGGEQRGPGLGGDGRAGHFQPPRLKTSPRKRFREKSGQGRQSTAQSPVNSRISPSSPQP